MQDLERALQQIVEGVVQKLGALLSGESGSEQHAKMNKLNRFLDKLSDIQAKIKSMKCAADQPLPDQVLPFALGLVIPGFFPSWLLSVTGIVQSSQECLQQWSGSDSCK